MRNKLECFIRTSEIEYEFLIDWYKREIYTFNEIINKMEDVGTMRHGLLYQMYCYEFIGSKLFKEFEEKLATLHSKMINDLYELRG